jgi:HK97 family phage portal protein
LNKLQKAAARLIFGASWTELISKWLTGDDDTLSDNNLLTINNETAMKYSTVFACVRVLSETLAATPIMLYEKQENGDRRANQDLPIFDVLHSQPNEQMSPFNFKEACMVALNTGGNAICQRLLNSRGEVVGLYPFTWDRVRIDRNQNTRKLEYKIKYDGEEKTLQRSKVFHIPGYSANGIVGMSPIEYMASAISLGQTYEIFGRQFYKNGANASGAFTHPGALSDVAFNRLKSELDQNYTGLKNTGKPLILEEGMNFTQFAIKPIDAQLLESKKFQIEDVARAYRVPMHLIQNLDRATFNNIEHLSLEFIMYTMLPWFKRWEENANAQLLTRYDRQSGYSKRCLCVGRALPAGGDQSGS